MSIDILDEFREHVKVLLDRRGCDNGKIGGCEDTKCCCHLARRLLDKNAEQMLTEDEIGTLLCETKISVLFRLTPAGLHEIYEKDIAYETRSGEWEASLEETARLDAEARNADEGDIDASEKAIVGKNEATRRRIEIAEFLLGRKTTLPETKDGKNMLLNTDMVLYAKHHPSYTDIFSEGNCKLSTASETEIVEHLYIEKGLSPRQIWEIWQLIFVHQVSEWLFITEEILATQRKMMSASWRPNLN